MKFSGYEGSVGSNVAKYVTEILDMCIKGLRGNGDENKNKTERMTKQKSDRNWGTRIRGLSLSSGSYTWMTWIGIEMMTKSLVFVWGQENRMQEKRKSINRKKRLRERRKFYDYYLV